MSVYITHKRGENIIELRDKKSHRLNIEEEIKGKES